MPFGVYDAAGTRTVEPIRDVNELISRLDLEATPLFSALPVTSTDQIKVEWMTDALVTEDGDNAMPYGGDAGSAQDTVRELVYNDIQVFWVVASVSEEQQRVAQYGVAAEMPYQKAKKLIELKRHVEARLVSDGERQAATPTNNDIGKFRALPRQITTNVSTSTFNQTNVDALLKTIKDAGGRADQCYCDGTRKQNISDFSGTDRRASQDPRTVTDTVDFYESDFGNIDVHYHEKMPHTLSDGDEDAEALILDMGLLGMREYLPFSWRKMDKTGLSDRELGAWHLTLMNKNELGHGAFKEQ